MKDPRTAFGQLVTKWLDQDHVPPQQIVDMLRNKANEIAIKYTPKKN